MKKIAILVTWLVSMGLISSANAQGNAAAGEAKTALCATCHGPGGDSQIPMNPRLAGQNATYLAKQINDYKSGARQNPTMSAMVASLSEQDILDIAAYYASQPTAMGSADAASIEIAESIYRAGNKDIAVPACSACHSPQGKGNAPAGWPSLSGQHAEYTLTQLKAFRAGERDNDANAMMRTTVERLTDKELQALANYLSGLH